MKDTERSLGQGGESLRYLVRRKLHEFGLGVHPDFPNNKVVNSHICSVDDRGVSPRNRVVHSRIIDIDFRGPVEPLTSSEIEPQQDRE